MKRLKVLLIGPFPPPAGGVAVHIQRMLQRSWHYPEVQLKAFDPRKKKLINSSLEQKGLFDAFRFFLSADIIHIHSTHRFALFIGRIAKLFGKILILTIHNSRSSTNNRNEKLIKLCDEVIYVFHDPQFPGRRVIPAYIPPVRTGKIRDELFNRMGNSRIVVSLGTSHQSTDSTGDVYGFDILLDSIAKLSSPFPVLIIIADTNGTYAEKYSKRIEEINITRKELQIIYFKESINFPALLSHADIYVRATRSDGDSIAIREALSAGVKVIASDCVIRPEGCELFETESPAQLAQKISDCLNSDKKKYPQEDFSNRIFSLYLTISDNV